MKKVLAITGIRSDYDLMSPLFKLLHSDPEVDLQLLVGGAHLSHTFGYSVNQIEIDDFKILAKIESLLDASSKSARLKSFSIFLLDSIAAIESFNPELILYAGDREDVMLGAMVGGYLEIPTVHFYGGDHVIDGHVDNPIRHAASKLSTAHFVALDMHRRRLISMGESEERVFVIGNLSLDKFVNFKPFSRKEISKKLDVKNEFDRHALMIFHPTSQDLECPYVIFENILLCLKERGINAYVSYPNIDPGNFEIRQVIERYSNDKDFVFYKNLDRELYLSIYKTSDFIIGNSSSGICEAASIPIPAINVGTRQTGRYAEENVKFVDHSRKSIGIALDSLSSASFITKVASTKNPYGDGNSAIKALKVIKEYDFDSVLLKKEDPLTFVGDVL